MTNEHLKITLANIISRLERAMQDVNQIKTKRRKKALDKILALVRDLKKQTDIF